MQQGDEARSRAGVAADGGSFEELGGVTVQAAAAGGDGYGGLVGGLGVGQCGAPKPVGRKQTGPLTAAMLVEVVR